jgi:hypothetical protein
MRSSFVLATVIVATALSACVRDSNSESTGKDEREVCGGPNGIGTATFDGGNFQPTNISASYQTVDPGGIGGVSPYQTTSPTRVLAIGMSSPPEGTPPSTSQCAAVGAGHQFNIIVYPEHGAIVAGDYQLPPSPSTQLEPPFATMDSTVCAFSCVAADWGQAGTVTVDSVGRVVTGSFSVTFTEQDADATTETMTGSFCAPICGD